MSVEEDRELMVLVLRLNILLMKLNKYIINEIKADITLEEVLEYKSHLTLATIYSALAYYYNQEFLDAEFAPARSHSRSTCSRVFKR